MRTSDERSTSSLERPRRWLERVYEDRIAMLEAELARERARREAAEARHDPEPPPPSLSPEPPEAPPPRQSYDVMMAQRRALQRQRAERSAKAVATRAANSNKNSHSINTHAPPAHDK